MVIGGQALLLYGEPRLTKDIDITLGVGTDELDTVQQSVSRLGLKLLVDDPESFVISTMVLPVQEEASGIRVDLICSFSPYARQAIERARAVIMGKATVQFAALEDVVIHKIIAGRARDLEDIRSILIKNPNHDATYITKWLEAFDAALDGDFSARFADLREDLEEEKVPHA